MDNINDSIEKNKDGESPPCEICSSPMYSTFYKDGHPYQKCHNCGLYRIYPQPTDEELDAIYDTGYYSQWGNGVDSFVPVKQKTFSVLFDMIKDHSLKGKRLLDVGAATGILMQVGQEKGYEVYGVEASTDGATAIAEKFGKDRIYHGYFSENFSHWSNETFDVIFMVDLLEHVRKPSEVLEKAKQLLKKKGILVIVYPDTNSLSRIILRRSWPHFNNQHLFSFSSKNIDILLKQHAFNIISNKVFLKAISIDYMGPLLPNLVGNIITSILLSFPEKIKNKIVLTPLGGSVIIVQKER